MKKVMLITLILVGMLTIPSVVAATVVTSENLGYDRLVDQLVELPPGGTIWNNNPGLEITFVNGIEYFQDFEILYLGDLPHYYVLNPAVNTSASTPFTVSNGDIAGKIHYNVHFVDGQPSKVQVWLTFDHFAPSSSGTVRYVLDYDKDAVSYINIMGRTIVYAHNRPTIPFACFSASDGVNLLHGNYTNIYTEKFDHDYVLTEYEH